MPFTRFLATTAAAVAMLAATGAQAQSNTTVLIGASGKTFASAAPQCVVNPATGVSMPRVQAGLFNPTQRTEATVSLDGIGVRRIEAERPSVNLWLAPGSHTVAVALSRRVVDRFSYAVSASQCNLPDTSGNFLSADGLLEYAASGKSYLLVTPGCALNPATGLAQPFVTLFDNGSFLLNVSVNGVPLTQLSATRPRAVVFLGAGNLVITAANGSLSTDTYLRNSGTGQCTL